LASRQALRALEVSRLELPWDPTLSAGPLHETSTEDYELPLWMFPVNPFTESTSSDVKRTGAELKSKHREAVLTPEEIQRRTEDYRDWLQRQGLSRLEDVGAVDAGTQSTAAREREEPLDRTGAGSR
jgi:hypothetical protein